MNIKASLIEWERVAYISNMPQVAGQFNAALEHVLALEAQVNERDARIESYKEVLDSLTVKIEEILTEVRNEK